MDEPFLSFKNRSIVVFNFSSPNFSRFYLVRIASFTDKTQHLKASQVRPRVVSKGCLNKYVLLLGMQYGSESRMCSTLKPVVVVVLVLC